MQRPLGVTIIAVLQFFGTALLIPFAFALGTESFRSTLGLSSVPAVSRFLALAGAGKLGAIGVLLFACFLVALGHGMWNLRNWARIATITAEAFGVACAVIGFLWALAHLTVFVLLFTCARLGISLLILWYLTRPQVIRAFGLVQGVRPESQASGASHI